MTKQDLIAAAAAASGVTKKDSQAVLDAVLDTVTSSLAKENQ